MAPAGPGSLGHHSPNVLADVPTIVHNLIRDMKTLEAALHRWSCAQASPEDVSDCYVQFGVEFNAVIHAFEAYDIPTRYAARMQHHAHALTTRQRSARDTDAAAVCARRVSGRGTLAECSGSVFA